MTSALSAERDSVSAIPAEERLRANLYMLLGGLLSRAPNGDILNATAQIEGDDSPLGRAISTLARVAERTRPETVAQEYHDLFIGLGRGELVPFGSYYLTGFLNEKPLAVLRKDMARLGIARPSHVKEPEDHVAALLDMMGGLITGAFGDPTPLDEQKRFFKQHLEPWAAHFFRDLEGAKASLFYAPVGTVGRALIEIETRAFEMD